MKMVRLLSILSAVVFASLGSGIAQSETALERIEARASNRPLRSLRQAAASARGQFFRPGPPREVPNYRGEPAGPSEGGPAVSLPDAAVQTDPGDGTTTFGAGFPGASNLDNAAQFGFLVAPPDTNGEVGASHFVQMINLLTTIYYKADQTHHNGDVYVAAFPSNAIWAGQGGNCEAYNQGDPVVLYDDDEDRWVVSQFAFPDSLSSYSQCVAVSEGPDPAGAYHRYEFSFNGIGFNDYPKHGIVNDSITMIANIFKPRGPFFHFSGTFIGVLDKAAMYAGDPASLIGFNLGTGEFGFVAGDLDGPGSADALFGTAMSRSDLFDIWQIDVDWSSENASASRIAEIPITAFDADLCSASREACIPQPDGGPSLESLSDRLMHRLQIRDFGTYRTMVASHTVDAGGGRAGIRWYELRESGGTWSLFQEGTFAPGDGEHRWMPSAAMNAAGDIGVGYLVASDGTYVSIGVSGQSAANSGSGFFDAEEKICAAGTGVQLGVARSGDYSATSIDPTTDTFWHTNEVFKTTGNFRWDTFVCEFAVGSGTPPTPNTAPTVTITAPADGAAFDENEVVNFSAQATDGEDDNGALTGQITWSSSGGGGFSGAPGGSVSRSFTPGNYTITASVTDNGGLSDEDSINIVVNAIGGGGAGVSVDSLTPSQTNEGRTWTAIVTIALVDGDSNPVAGTTVEGDWSAGNPAGSCVTLVGGVCSVSLSGIRKNQSPVVFTITNVDHPDWDGVTPSVAVAKP